MNGSAANISQRPNIVQIIAVVGAVLIALVLAFAIMWCAIWKIWIDAPMLMSISTILGGIGGALTTILVGRSIAQLNQPDEPISTKIEQPKNEPVPVIATGGTANFEVRNPTNRT